MAIDHQGWLLAMLVAAAGTFGAIQLLLSRLRQLALDVPNHRSMHTAPVPRTGGWAIWAGVASALALSPVALRWDVALPFALLLTVSLMDDLKPLSARVRFLVQSLSVWLVLTALVPELVVWWLAPLVVVGIWVVNLYNFMDGMDGFAGSMTAIGFATLCGISFWKGNGELAGICAVIAVSTLVFLYFNLPGAKIFLGDAGSTVIGLAVFAVAVSGWSDEVFSPLIPLLVFAPFWVDATWTLLKRIRKGERWWEAHRQHYYQRTALKIGVGKTLRREVIVMAGLSVTAVALVVSGLQ
ncbi:MraY family glycosyltransferase [Microbulbifer celer]|uniref:Glycosyltransferase family 4 protein n=1 Tax=Microbulbifer celer TaxID=435905 RepID=A0ABW3U650_9GAMM|nr:glycosyltransferase family 4 protein [Microbulbifer celer]UFN58524.1 glycosyltransferase family 4 protein [Microbulbifer celer]